MSIDDAIKIIQGIGFPGAIAFFVLWRLERSLLAVRDEISELRRDQTIRRIIDDRKPWRRGDDETNRSQP